MGLFRDYSKPDACAGKQARDGEQTGTVWDTELDRTRDIASRGKSPDGARLTKGNQGSEGE